MKETTSKTGANEEVSVRELYSEVDRIVSGVEAFEEVKTAVIECWARLDGQEVGNEVWRYPGQLDRALAALIPRLDHAKLLEAVGLTFQAVGSKHDSSRVRYFCGVCWNMIKSPEPEE